MHLTVTGAGRRSRPPRGHSQLVSTPRCRLKAGQARRRPLGMVFPFQGLQRSMARFKAQPEGPGLLLCRAALLEAYLE
ncbi:hypothetical protein PFWH6_3559 [Pseudomonas fluorescens WH6]|nr:hypothetical protein PFWH6_3559 [Pseudomonas fluorescens WH6]